jgi:cytochrome P450
MSTTANEHRDVDFFRGRELLADPYPYFHWMRSQGPVWREPHHGVFMVTGYDEACRIYTDPERFSSCNSVTGPFPGFPVPIEGREDAGELIERYRDRLPFSDQLPTMDPPTHRDHRHLLMRQLTPKRLKENEEFMWRLADRQIDEFAPRGACELISEYAGPFTLLVIADLLGVPEEDHTTFLDELQRRPPRRGRVIGSVGDQTMAHRPLEFLYERFARYIEDRRARPRDDVLTALATTTFPDGTLPEVIDVVRVAANLFAAGQETTVRLLGSAFRLIAERDDLQALLRERRDLIPDFVEETLRYESPVKGDFRLARERVEIGGVEIPPGGTVMLLNGAANRDPRRFPDPDEFRIDRPNAREHVAFGRGPHSCPGGPLARTEARVSIERFLDRFAEIRIAEAHHGPPGARHFEYAPTYILRGLRRLHLELTAAG